MTYNAMILEASKAHLNLEEWPGARHNPAIVQMFADSGHAWVRDDETPWCAAFVGSVLAEVGLHGTGKLNARSYSDWGQPVPMADARPGDVVVFSRGDPKGWQGHVGFFVRFEGSSIIVRGGNQGNKVSDAPYSLSRLLDIRRADGGASDTGRPLLKEGSKGRFVVDLQEALATLGFHSGAVDGHFGPLTKASVMAFQSRNGLTTDGIVGRRTWAAFEGEPVPQIERHVSTKSLRESGSRGIRAADQTKKASLVGGATGVAVAGAAARLHTDIKVAQEAIEELSAGVEVSGPLADVLPLILGGLGLVAVIVGLVTWVQAQRATEARTDDARSGAHLGR